jgi:hypothetical protein
MFLFDCKHGRHDCALRRDVAFHRGCDLAPLDRGIVLFLHFVKMNRAATTRLRHPGVFVADGGGEEFEEAAIGAVASTATATAAISSRFPLDKALRSR